MVSFSFLSKSEVSGELFICASTVLFLLRVGEVELDEDRKNVILISGEFPNYVLIIGLGC